MENKVILAARKVVLFLIDRFGLYLKEEPAPTQYYTHHTDKFVRFKVTYKWVTPCEVELLLGEEVNTRKEKIAEYIALGIYGRLFYMLPLRSYIPKRINVPNIVALTFFSQLAHIDPTEMLITYLVGDSGTVKISAFSWKLDFFASEITIMKDWKLVIKKENWDKFANRLVAAMDYFRL